MRRLAPLLPLPLFLAFGAWGSARAADVGGSALGAALSAVATVIGSEQAPAEEDETDADGTTIPVSTFVTSDTTERLAGSSRSKTKGHAAPQKAPSIFVSADQVLRLADGRAVPRGVRVPADGARPAGLRLLGVGALGIGLRDGDVLTRALGLPALSSSAVVRAVLVARSQRVKVLEGEFYRGRERWVLRVEQPYLDDQRGALTTTAHGPRLPGP